MCLVNMNDKATNLIFSCFGARICVVSAIDGLLKRVEEILPPKSHIEHYNHIDRCFYVTKTGRCFRIHHDSQLLAQSEVIDDTLNNLRSFLDQAVAIFARNVLFVHAGVVGWKNRAIVIPGRSMSGKTTLVAALINAGADYLSDEYAVLDDKGRVHPYDKPLSVRNAQGIATLISVEELGANTAPQPLKVGMIVQTTYQPGSRWRPRELTSGQAMMAMLDNTVVIREIPQLAMKILSASSRNVVAITSSRGECEGVAQYLLSQP